MSKSPDPALKTGSTTSFKSYFSEASATTFIISLEYNIPVLAISMLISSSIVSICFLTKFAGNGKISFTPFVFWAVRAVIAVAP